MFDAFLVKLHPTQYKGHAVDNGLIWLVYDDETPNRLASLNLNKVSRQPSGDPTVSDHPKNTETWIDNSCEK